VQTLQRNLVSRFTVLNATIELIVDFGLDFRTMKWGKSDGAHISLKDSKSALVPLQKFTDRPPQGLSLLNLLCDRLRIGFVDNFLWVPFDRL